MSNQNSFFKKITEVIAVLNLKGYEVKDVDDLLDIYESHLKWLNECYNDVIEEYENDLWIRVWLEDIVIGVTENNKEFDHFINRLKTLDSLLIDMTQPVELKKPSKWWFFNRVLLVAGERYVESVESLYKVKIRTC